MTLSTVIRVNTFLSPWQPNFKWKKRSKWNLHVFLKLVSEREILMNICSLLGCLIYYVPSRGCCPYGSSYQISDRLIAHTRSPNHLRLPLGPSSRSSPGPFLCPPWIRPPFPRGDWWFISRPFRHDPSVSAQPRHLTNSWADEKLLIQHLIAEITCHAVRSEFPFLRSISL